MHPESSKVVSCENTALHRAIAINSFQTVKKLVAEKKELLYSLNPNGETPLMVAASYIDALDIFAYLLPFYEKVPEGVPGLNHSRDSDGNTVAHIIVQSNNFEAGKLLFKSPAYNPTIANRCGVNHVFWGKDALAIKMLLGESDFDEKYLNELFNKKSLTAAIKAVASPSYEVHVSSFFRERTLYILNAMLLALGESTARLVIDKFSYEAPDLFNDNEKKLFIYVYYKFYELQKKILDYIITFEKELDGMKKEIHIDDCRHIEKFEKMSAMSHQLSKCLRKVIEDTSVFQKLFYQKLMEQLKDLMPEDKLTKLIEAAGNPLLSRLNPGLFLYRQKKDDLPTIKQIKQNMSALSQSTAIKKEIDIIRAHLAIEEKETGKMKCITYNLKKLVEEMQRKSPIAAFNYALTIVGGLKTQNKNFSHLLLSFLQKYNLAVLEYLNTNQRNSNKEEINSILEKVELGIFDLIANKAAIVTGQSLEALKKELLTLYRHKLLRVFSDLGDIMELSHYFVAIQNPGFNSGCKLATLTDLNNLLAKMLANLMEATKKKQNILKGKAITALFNISNSLARIMSYTSIQVVSAPEKAEAALEEETPEGVPQLVNYVAAPPSAPPLVQEVKQNNFETEKQAVEEEQEYLPLDDFSIEYTAKMLAQNKFSEEAEDAIIPGEEKSLSISMQKDESFPIKKQADTVVPGEEPEIFDPASDMDSAPICLIESSSYKFQEEKLSESNAINNSTEKTIVHSSSILSSAAKTIASGVTASPIFTTKQAITVELDQLDFPEVPQHTPGTLRDDKKNHSEKSKEVQKVVTYSY